MKKEKFIKWLKAAAIRAAKTIAQSAIAAIGTSAAIGDVKWIMVASTAVLSGILSLLTSVTGLPELELSEEKTGTSNPENNVEK